MRKINKLFIMSVLAAATMVSCSEDSLDPTLAVNKSVETSINTEEDLQGILLGMYNRLTSTQYYGRDIIIYGDARSDNAFSNGNSGRFVTVSTMAMTETDGQATGTWTQIYQVIASANIVIGADVTGDETAINHIKGQAYAVRALAHFDALRLYGQQHVQSGGLSALGVPYVTEFKGENLLPTRNTVGEVKALIEEDFATALSLMSQSLNDPSKQYITTHAVNGLWSRVEIYFGDYQKALTAAAAVVNSNEFSIVPAGDFVASWSIDGAVNSIFELAVNNNDNNGINGLANIYRGNTYGDIQAYDAFANIFDAGDIRGSAEMIDVDGAGNLRNIGKYPSATFDDNISIIRYEEVVLNYAEALQNTGGNGLVFLNSIANNRNALPYATASQANILLERRKELSFEGFRFDDLARSNMDIPNLDPNQAGPAYGSFNYAFPIPAVETNANSNMVQNFGYSN